MAWDLDELSDRGADPECPHCYLTRQLHAFLSAHPDHSRELIVSGLIQVTSEVLMSQFDGPDFRKNVRAAAAALVFQSEMLIDAFRSARSKREVDRALHRLNPTTQEDSK